MAINIAASVSIKGDGAENEDLFGCEGVRAWVLDGATGLGPSVIGGGTDARWFVDVINASFRRILKENPKAPTHDLMRASIRSVQDEYAVAAQNADTPVHPPSAAFAMLCAQGNRIELSSLGDCAALYEKTDGTIGNFQSKHISQLEEVSLARLREEQRTFPEASHQALVGRLGPQLRANRAKMNKPDGYWILSFSGDAVEHLHVEKIEIAKGTPVILMSDGFTRAFEMLDDMDNAALYKTVLEKGPAYVAREIRDREENDSTCRQFPRFKKSDDATCIVVETS